jgi:hypothetical protein
MSDRSRPQGRGALRALLIAPRTFAYYVCVKGCMRSLYFTYAGEACPFDDCGAPITAECYVQGEIAGADGRAIDFRSRSPLTPAPQMRAKKEIGHGRCFR